MFMGIKIGIPGGDEGPPAPPPTYTAQALALFAAMTVQPDATRKNVINDVFVGLLSDPISGSNLFAKLDALCMYWAHDVQASLINWISPGTYDATLSTPTAPTFTIDRGFQGDGAASYVDTNFNPTTAPSPKFTQNDATYGIWLRTSSQKTNSSAGWFNTNGTTILPRNTSDILQCRVNNATAYNGGSSTDGSGLTAVSRFGPLTADLRIMKNGVLRGKSSGSGSTAPQNNNFYDGHATSSTYSDAQIAARFIGQAFSENEHLGLFTILNAYATAVGA